MLKNEFMLEAIKQALIAKNEGEIPIGCVIINQKTKQIVTKAYNKTKQNPLLHAEIIALNKALETQNTNQLKNHALYVTLEPCLMCYGALANAGIQTVYYGLPCSKTGAIDSNSLIDNAKCATVESYGHFYENKIKELMQGFFAKKR